MCWLEGTLTALVVAKRLLSAYGVDEVSLAR